MLIITSSFIFRRFLLLWFLSAGRPCEVHSVADDRITCRTAGRPADDHRQDHPGESWWGWCQLAWSLQEFNLPSKCRHGWSRTADLLSEPRRGAAGSRSASHSFTFPQMQEQNTQARIIQSRKGFPDWPSSITQGCSWKQKCGNLPATVVGLIFYCRIFLRFECNSNHAEFPTNSCIQKFPQFRRFIFR